jgi:hypothetical protein
MNEFSSCLDMHQTWFLILKEKYKLEIFEDRVLKEKFGPNCDREMEKNYIMRSSIICTLH